MELLGLDGLSAANIDSWRSLADHAVEPNPFFEPDYCLPLARATGQLGEVRLAVVRTRDEWIACMPVLRSRRWHRAPVVNVSTWRPRGLYSLLGTPLLAPGRLSEAAEGLATGLLGLKRTALVGLDWLVESGPVLDALSDAFAAHSRSPLVLERFERAALRRRPDNDYAQRTVSPKHRREWRRQLRKLGEEVGDVGITDRAGDPAAVDALIAMEARQSVAERGQVLAADPAHAAFFREMCAAYAAAGRLELYELRAGDVALAYKCNLLAREWSFMLKIAFDESYKGYSPGMQLELEMLNFFHARPNISWMDSCADPNNAMINRLWPERRSLTTLVLPTSALARPAVRILKVYRKRQSGG